MVDGWGGEQAGAPVLEQCDLVGQEDVYRIDPIRRGPHDGAVGGLGGQLHRHASGQRGRAGGIHRLVDQSHRRLCGHLNGGGEADGTAMDDPDAYADLGVVSRGLEPGVA